MTTYYMHTVSGDVATKDEWRADFESMDIETWFGLPVEQCRNLDWIGDAQFLVEVRQDENGKWVEV